MKTPSSPDVTDGVEMPNGDSLQHAVSCDVWNVQQLAAGGRWNTLLTESNKSDAERAVDRLAKSGERNLRFRSATSARASGIAGVAPKAGSAFSRHKSEMSREEPPQDVKDELHRRMNDALRFA